jgi:hypothetical protein
MARVGESAVDATTIQTGCVTAEHAYEKGKAQREPFL